MFIALFIAVLFAGDRAGAYGLGALVQASQFRISKLYGGTIQADTVIFGNSRGMYSMFPADVSALTCRPAFNASHYALSPAIVDALFEDFLNRNPAPKFALFEVSNSSSGDKTILKLRPYVKGSPNLQAIYSRMDKAFPYWSQLTQLHYYDSEMLLNALYYLGHSDQGWTVASRHISPEMIQAFSAKSEIDDEPDPEGKIRHYRNILSNARRFGIQVVFFVAPYHPIVFKVHPDAAAWIRGFQNSMGPGMELLDFSRALSDDELFSDAIHVNRLGSKQLIERFLSTDTGRLINACNTSH